MKNLALLFPVIAMFLLAFTIKKTDLGESQPSSFEEEKAAIETALMDYVEGLYLTDTSRIHRSVATTLEKRGYWFDDRKGEYTEPLQMTFRQLVDLTKRWNADGKRADENSVKKVEVYDIMDKTASGKVTAVWGIDYCHLAKHDGKWYIMNILWQSPTPAATPGR